MFNPKTDTNRTSLFEESGLSKEIKVLTWEWNDKLINKMFESFKKKKF